MQSGTATGENSMGWLGKSKWNSLVIQQPHPRRVPGRIAIGMLAGCLRPHVHAVPWSARCADTLSIPWWTPNKANVGTHAMQHHSAPAKETLARGSVGKPADLMLREISPTHKSARRVQCWKCPASDGCMRAALCGCIVLDSLSHPTVEGELSPTGWRLPDPLLCYTASGVRQRTGPLCAGGQGC